ncbi:MAG: hypothetical protein M3Y24_07270 [Acidobacteriota bacterium]|nr:hypothetical protein [Acidobacteriota bacterium]
MRLFFGLLLAASVLAGGDVLSVFGYQWSVVSGPDWRIRSENGAQVLQLVTPLDPLPGPRRPIQFALAQTPDFSRVSLELDAKPRRRSLILAFAYRDPAHFDYAHLSIDTGIQQPMHTGIFHVFGGERVRISSQSGPAAFPETDHWYHIILKHDGETGTVDVSVDGRAVPALRAVDLSLTSGRIGLGSFDEVGDFRNVRIAGVPARPN